MDQRKKILSRLRFRSPFARLTLWTLGLTSLLLISGKLLTASGAGGACPNWPLCDQNLFPTNLQAWVNLGHRLFALLVAGFMLALLRKAWRTQRSQTAILVTTTTTASLYFAQSLVAGVQVLRDSPQALIWVHRLTALAVWVSMLTLFTLVGLSARTEEEEKAEGSQSIQRTRLARDFLALTKPIVVSLLLVTTLAGMVIGAQAWPSIWEAFWVLLAGAMAAGGSGAINQYIDRDDDLKMQRTQKRPIPSGRLTPAEGLAFGAVLCVGSFYLMVVFVNLAAALLTLTGIIYYIVIYSIFLKKTTVQNIVIGGGAGAVPPLVGWAAATGGLNVPSLFLFAVVFMWTPPHFWALALVRRKDYARAKVPMLPVVRGEKETRWQIFLYTVALVALTLTLPLFGLGSGVYLFSAGLLGLGLLYSAWRVWRYRGNKVAWQMYRHSSTYLALLFAAMMVDALV